MPDEEITHYGTGEIATELVLAIQDGEHATVDHHLARMTDLERAGLRRVYLALYWRLAPERERNGKPGDAVPFRSLRDPEAAE